MFHKSILDCHPSMYFLWFFYLVWSPWTLSPSTMYIHCRNWMFSNLNAWQYKSVIIEKMAILHLCEEMEKIRMEPGLHIPWTEVREWTLPFYTSEHSVMIKQINKASYLRQKRTDWDCSLPQPKQSLFLKKQGLQTQKEAFECDISCPQTEVTLDRSSVGSRVDDTPRLYRWCHLSPVWRSAFLMTWKKRQHWCLLSFGALGQCLLSPG